MKKLANLKGAKALNKKEQKNINGGAGGGCCNPANECCMVNPNPGRTYIPDPTLCFCV